MVCAESVDAVHLRRRRSTLEVAPGADMVVVVCDMEHHPSGGPAPQAYDEYILGSGATWSKRGVGAPRPPALVDAFTATRRQRRRSRTSTLGAPSSQRHGSTDTPTPLVDSTSRRKVWLTPTLDHSDVDAKLPWRRHGQRRPLTSEPTHHHRRRSRSCWVSMCHPAAPHGWLTATLGWHRADHGHRRWPPPTRSTAQVSTPAPGARHGPGVEAKVGPTWSRRRGAKLRLTQFWSLDACAPATSDVDMVRSQVRPTFCVDARGGAPALDPRRRHVDHDHRAPAALAPSEPLPASLKWTSVRTDVRQPDSVWKAQLLGGSRRRCTVATVFSISLSYDSSTHTILSP